MDRVAQILDFWFEGVDDSTLIDRKKDPFRKWFNGGRRLDRTIKERFEEDLAFAASGKYEDWGDVPQVRLALILLLDQFSRHIYRNTSKMYAFDEQAVALSLRTIDDGMDRQLSLIQRMFVYMPLHHSEELRMQELSVRYFNALVEDCRKVNPDNLDYYEYNFEYAQKHWDIIRTTGRFLHRDQVLDRV